MRWTFMVLLILTAWIVDGFSPAVTKQTKPTTELKAAFQRHYDFNYVLAKARECAYNDHATEAEARQFLQEILAFQGACVSGKLVGEPRCDDVTEIADTVAHLRSIILRNEAEEGFSVLDETPSSGNLVLAAIVGIVVLIVASPLQGVMVN